MPIQALKAFNDNYIWILVNEKNHTFAAVDPGDANPVLAFANTHQLKLSDILITHHHPDHAGGISELLENFPNTQVYGPIDNRLALIQHPVRDENIIHVGCHAFRVINTPGHTRTHICYQEPTRGWLFCGDTLFSAGCGRVFDGTMAELHHSIQLLKSLPKDTKIYCGHEYTRNNLYFAATIEPHHPPIRSYLAYLEQHPMHCSLPSTIAKEREINPFMRTEMPDIIAYAQQQGVSAIDSLSIFSLLRQKKDSFVHS